MTSSHLLGAGSLIVIIVFVVFAFRQGLKVKPDDRPDPGPPAGYDGDSGGFGGHGLG
jgi:hypothetical protein